MLHWMLKFVSSNIPGWVGSSAAYHPGTLAPQSSIPISSCFQLSWHCFLMFLDFFGTGSCSCCYFAKAPIHGPTSSTNPGWASGTWKESRVCSKHRSLRPFHWASYGQLHRVSVSLFLFGLVSASCQLTLLSVVELLYTRKGPFSARASASATCNCTHASGINNHYRGGIKVWAQTSCRGLCRSPRQFCHLELSWLSSRVATIYILSRGRGETIATSISDNSKSIFRTCKDQKDQNPKLVYLFRLLLPVVSLVLGF